MTADTTITYIGLQTVTTRHTKNGEVTYQTGEPIPVYEVFNRTKYGVWTDIYPVIPVPIRDGYIILSVAGYEDEDGEPFYDRALSIPKILLKELVNNEI